MPEKTIRRFLKALQLITFWFFCCKRWKILNHYCSIIVGTEQAFYYYFHYWNNRNCPRKHPLLIVKKKLFHLVNFSRKCVIATNKSFTQTGLFAKTCYKNFSKNKYKWLLLFFVTPKISKNKSTKIIYPRFNKWYKHRPMFSIKTAIKT